MRLYICSVNTVLCCAANSGLQNRSNANGAHAKRRDSRSPLLQENARFLRKVILIKMPQKCAILDFSLLCESIILTTKKKCIEKKKKLITFFLIRLNKRRKFHSKSGQKSAIEWKLLKHTLLQLSSRLRLETCRKNFASRSHSLYFATA